MKTIYKGVIDGNIIHLDASVGLPFGTPIEVILRALHHEEQEAITQRQLAMLEQGFHLGKKLYGSREDLYDRTVD